MLLTVIIVILFLNYFLERWLNYLNGKMWSSKLPPELSGIYDEEKYRLAQYYDKAKKKLSFITSSFSLVAMLILLFTGSFSMVLGLAEKISYNPVWATLIFFGILFILSDIVSLPFDMYRIFVIEDRFGFNRTTLKIFFADKLKGYLLGGLIGGSILALFVIFYQLTGKSFWIYLWITISVVMLLTTMFYSSVIVPMFNRLKPLEAGDLRKSIEAYCSKVKFTLSDLFIMDGSKRSTKANAFFSGLGRKKRIVLYDTLVEKHTTDELVAVLAHEIGHYKKKHTRTSLLLAIVQSGLMLFIFSRFIDSPGLSQAMGSNEVKFQLGMLSFAILYSPISILIGLMMNYVSRLNEFAADRYASETFSAIPLKEALKKLSVHQLSNLHPHPWYVFFYYSHPPLMERLKALEKIAD